MYDARSQCNYRQGSATMHASDVQEIPLVQIDGCSFHSQVCVLERKRKTAQMRCKRTYRRNYGFGASCLFSVLQHGCRSVSLGPFVESVLIAQGS